MTRCANALCLALVVLLMAVVGIGFAEQQWISLDGSPVSPPQVRTLSHSSTETILQLDLHGFYAEDISAAGESFQRLSFGDWGSTLDVGGPMLPTINELVAIPARSDLRVQVSQIKSVTLPGYRIYPYQKPTTDASAQPDFAYDAEAYAQDALYPQEIARLSSPQIWRDIRLAELHLTPVRYNAARRELEIITSCEIRVEYFGFNPANALDREPTSVLPPYAEMYRQAVVNYDWLGLNDRGTDAPGTKYLFVMKAEAQPYVQPLINFRHAQGYKTEVKLYPAVNFDDEYDIKNYINQLYNTAGLEFVMLVGDAYYAGGPGAVDVPMHLWGATYSDSWYSALQGDDDNYPDIAVGRLTYDNLTELDHQIDKIMDYLQIPNTTSNWPHNSLLVAHQEQYPLKYTQCKEEIRTFAYALETPAFSTAYGGAGATNSTVINYLNTIGTGLLNYRGHGSQSEWWHWYGASGSFTATEVNQLTNFNKYFVHFDVCCENMDIPNFAGNCLAESFMKAPAAAIAINAGIVDTYTIPNHTYDKEFYKALFHNGIWRIGYASNYSNVVVVNTHGSIGVDNYRTYLWLGDAATDLWTGTPQPLTMNFQASYNLGTQDFTVTVTKNGQPVANALVCAQSATAYARGYTNGSGVAILTFLEYPAAITTVTLTATAHNGLAATGSCTVIPATAPYNLLVDINPTSSTTIPASGGSFNFTADVRNNEAYAIPAMIWTDWIYPSGTIHTPFINRYMNLTAGLHINRSLTQTVAGSEPAGTYTFRACVGTYQGGAIFAMDTFTFVKAGSDGNLGPWVNESATLGWDEGQDADGAVLPQNYAVSLSPNPFNPATAISYQLAANSLVSLKVYDTAGKLVQTLVDGWREAGSHEVTFDGSGLVSGVYIYRLDAGSYRASGKMVLMK